MRVNKKNKRCNWCNDTGVQTNGERYGDNFHWWKCEQCKGNKKSTTWQSGANKNNLTEL